MRGTGFAGDRETRTAASAAVPRWLTTPRKATAICDAVCGEITCLTIVGFNTLIGFPLSSMIVFTIRGWTACPHSPPSPSP